MSDSTSTDPADPPTESATVPVGDWSVAVDLEATVDGHTLQVSTREGRLAVEADSLTALRRLADLEDALRESLPGSLEAPLESLPLTLSVRGVEVARVDSDVPAGPLSRLLGIAPARVRVRGLLRAALARR